MDYTKLNDQTLIRLIARSQENAFSELYDRYSRLVYSMALNILGEPAGAEEITQDVFIRIWENADSYKAEKAKVVTWITSMTRYRSIDVIRRKKVRPEGHTVSWDIRDMEPARDQSNQTDVELQVEIIQKKQRVRKALALLPEEQRQTLSYAYFMGYTQQEIANIMGEPLGTVKTRIRLAMKKLRQMLEQGQETGG